MAMKKIGVFSKKMDELKKKVEAHLFIVSKGLKVHELAEKINTSEVKILKAIDSLKKDYKKTNRAFNIINLDNTYRLNVDRKLINSVSEVIPSEFNKSLIKTLS
ncbi:MAG: SMC-Scp complex subunit ScpB, partial [Candidatus Aenigmatarchaeota archaeon]